MSFHRLTQSVKEAGRGLRHTFKNEQNFRLQALIGLGVAAAAIYFPLRAWERILVFLLIGLVMTVELLNTALECCMDLLKPRLHHYVRNIKDIMAAAVLVSALGAGVIGLIIFLPHLLKLFK